MKRHSVVPCIYTAEAGSTVLDLSVASLVDSKLIDGNFAT